MLDACRCGRYVAGYQSWRGGEGASAGEEEEEEEALAVGRRAGVRGSLSGPSHQSGPAHEAQLGTHGSHSVLQPALPAAAVQLHQLLDSQPEPGGTIKLSSAPSPLVSFGFNRF